MAVTTYAQITSLIPEIWEAVLWYADHNFMMPRAVSVFADESGMTPRNVSEYIENGIVQAVAESDDISERQLIRNLLTTIVPQEFGDRIDLYRQRIITDDSNVVADAARDLGYTLGKSMETNLLATATGVTGGNMGDGTEVFDLASIIQARTHLGRLGIPGPYYVALHPFHFADVLSSFIDISQPAPLSFRSSSVLSYRMPGFADTQIFIPTLHPTAEVQTLTRTSTGGNFTLTVRMGDNEETTANISGAATLAAATIEAALETLTFVAAADVAVTGAAGGPFTITWSRYDYTAVVTVNDVDLTGGTVTIATTAGKAKSVLYTRDALVLDMRAGLLLETERDVSARRMELVATQIYGHGLWRGSRGVTLNYDATPSVT